VLAANAPITSPDEPVASVPPLTVPEVHAPPGPPSQEPSAEAASAPPEPLMITSDLAVGCPQRQAPEYPPASRRMGEQGHVLLQVELDETGRVATARIKEGSGFKRLDGAALAAVKQWHCNAPTRNGSAVRAVAMQPFNFVLEGRR
jgi:protein TonB